MAKQTKKEEIEEAVVIEESTAILVTTFNAPVLPKLIDKDKSLATIRESLKSYDDVVIADTKDKANYDKVNKGMAKFKADRIAWEKAVNQNISDPVKKWLAETKTDIESIVGEFKSAESTLRTKKDAIDLKKKEEKEAAENAKVKLMTERVEVIINLGGKSSGDKYVFDYDMALFVTLTQMKELDENKWATVLKEIQDAYDADQKRIADEKKAEEELASSNAAKEKELRDKQRVLRQKELKLEGFTFSPRDGVFTHEKGSSINVEAVDEYSDEDWDQFIAGVQHTEAVEEADEDMSFDVSSVDTPEEQVLDIPNAESAPEQTDLEELSFETSEPETQVASNSSRTATVTIEFDITEPYLEFPMGQGFIQRIFNPAFEDYAEELTESQSIVLRGQINEELQFMLIAVKS